MVKSKKKSKKKKAGSKKAGNLKPNIIKSVAGFFILLVLVIGAGFLAKYFIPEKKPLPVKIQVPLKIKEQKKKVTLKPPVFEVYPKEEKHYVKIQPIKIKSLKHNLPDVAIIIDDIGYHPDLEKKYLELDAAFTFSVLPFSPYKNITIEAARKKGREIMLHLPMEPNEYPEISPGPGALLTSMSPDQLISQINEDIDDVPFIKGVNNHMGSKMSASDVQMNQIFSVLKARGLYFIDSKTGPKTYGRESARLFKLTFAERDVFIDHKQDREFIKNQIYELIKIANRHGKAIAIMHPYPLTYQVVSEMLPYMKKKMNIVPASAIVKDSS
ncbi:divergent polysaccharide deacetylase family protein [Desulfobacterium sp. N47]|uniref:divergent polysaccharide deacetylase family protein n=1 Tax=Desulfobacterium sp. N47 TaxID=3115210 RepID=UPI003F4A1879